MLGAAELIQGVVRGDAARRAMGRGYDRDVSALQALFLGGAARETITSVLLGEQRDAARVLQAVSLGSSRRGTLAAVEAASLVLQAGVVGTEVRCGTRALLLAEKAVAARAVAIVVLQAGIRGQSVRECCVLEETREREAAAVRLQALFLSSGARGSHVEAMSLAGLEATDMLQGAWRGMDARRDVTHMRRLIVDDATRAVLATVAAREANKTHRELEILAMQELPLAIEQAAARAAAGSSGPPLVDPLLVAAQQKFLAGDLAAALALRRCSQRLRQQGGVPSDALLGAVGVVQGLAKGYGIRSDLAWEMSLAEAAETLEQGRERSRSQIKAAATTQGAIGTL